MLKIYKKLSQYNNNKPSSLKNGQRNYVDTFLQRAQPSDQRSLVIKEMQIKTTLRYPLIPVTS